jgi:transposase InsO family protein
VFAAIDQIVIEDSVSASRVCSLLEVSRSGFYSWRKDQQIFRELKDVELISLIHNIFWTHRSRYGARRIAAELKRRDVLCGVGRVARLLKTQGLRAIQPRSFKPKTTESRHRLGYNDNLLSSYNCLSSINEVWVGDITYIPLRGGRFSYLSMLMDLFSRRIIGWSYRRTMGEELVIDSLKKAIGLRQPSPGLIHHTDRGGQYASKRYRSMLRRASMRQSMSAADNCYDNAFMESCFGTIKNELQLEDYATDAEAIRELGSYINYYNLERLHSSLGYVTPSEFETQPFNQLANQK